MQSNQDCIGGKRKDTFAVGKRVIQMYLNRWASINKALEYVGKPYNPYGKTVNNLPPPTEEGDDKNARHLDLYLESPQMRRRTTQWKKRIILSNKLRTTRWIAKVQEAAAATQSKRPWPKLIEFLILVIVAHTVYYI
jgi:hypothetical protein